MFSISQLADEVGLSRSTLLYYEKIGLLKAQRQANGYRVYSDAEKQRLRFVQQLQAGGLSLKECQACIDGQLDRGLLAGRLEVLEADIAEKTRSRDLLLGLLGRSGLKEWHDQLERVAPDLHRTWLMRQGYSQADAGHIALVSKDMNAHESYMADFMHVFAGLDMWGPGSEAAIAKALRAIPDRPSSILEIGCGNGVATMQLLARTDAKIHATDTALDALDRLRAKLKAVDAEERVCVQHADMGSLEQPKAPYDAIWCEGSAYIIGVERALHEWRALLRPGGTLVYSDMVWRTPHAGNAIKAFWASEYPRMAAVDTHIRQAKKAGWRVITHFDMGPDAMDNYYGPLAARLDDLADDLAGHRVLDDLRAELRAYQEGREQFGYEMFVLQRT